MNLETLHYDNPPAPPEPKPATLDTLRERYISQHKALYHAKVEAEFQTHKLGHIEKEIIQAAPLKRGTIVMVNKSHPEWQPEFAPSPRKAVIIECIGAFMTDDQDVQLRYLVRYMRGRKVNRGGAYVTEGQIIEIISTPTTTNP